MSPTLESYCHAVICKYSENWPPTEQKLAEEFLPFFSLTHLLDNQLFELCQKLGVEISFAALPEGLYGLNACHSNKRGIVLTSTEIVPGGNTHTLLHELRELLEYGFSDLGRPTVGESGIEYHAESFAQAARLVGARNLAAMLLTSAIEIETKWKRWLAVGGIVTMNMAHIVGCFMHSQLEDAVIQQRRKQLQ